jgi:ATP/maltotriose-dependent transcriptional regulator MalT
MNRLPALAKLTRPRPHQAVERRRLFAALDDARRVPLVWLTAPPGAGKTTLAATYLEGAARAVVWYQVDPGDSDPAAFFHYLALAVGGPGRRRKDPLPSLAPEHLSDLPGFARRFFRQLFARYADGAILVFDNFQEVAEPGLTSILREACAETPPCANIMVLSRTEPPTALVELQARGMLTLLDWTDLRLTHDETRAMCARRGVLEEWVVRALHQQADGWAAGVTLMLERFKRAGASASTLSADTHQSVFSYFANLIFDQATPAVRDILLALAFAPRMTTTLARELSGSTEAPRLLEALHRRHLFTDRRPGVEPVYQFHALFQAFLRAKAGELLPQQRLRERMLDTALALGRSDEWEHAYPLLAQVCSWKEAIGLIRARAAELLATGRWQTLIQWIEAIPDAELQREPWLRYWAARAQAQTDPPRAASTFANAQALFAERGERAGRVLSLAGLLQTSTVDYTDFRTVDRWLDALAEEIAVDPPSLQPEQEIAVWSALLIAGYFARPWHPCVPTALDRVEAMLGTLQDGPAALEAATSVLTVAAHSAQMD